MEMVQGEGSVINPQGVRAAGPAPHPRAGHPAVVDEVQTGCGRTGSWFAFEQYDIEPDVIIASKALSGMGLPVAIVIYDEKLDVWNPGAHTGTFRGNQLAFAAGAKSVEIVRRDGRSARTASCAAVSRSPPQLSGLASHPGVLEVRGRGLMWGIELNAPATGGPSRSWPRTCRHARCAAA